MADGPIVIAFDGTPASERAIRESAELLGARPALVVTVWKQGLGFELVALPGAGAGLPPASLDIATAAEVDRALAEGAQRTARRGAGLARDAGFTDVEGLAIADDVDVPVAETIVRVATERNAAATVVGSHGHGRIGEVVLGSTSRDVIRRAPCPVVVVRAREEDDQT